MQIFCERKVREGEKKKTELKTENIAFFLNFLS